MKNRCTLDQIELRQAALNWLTVEHPERKAFGVGQLQKAFLAGDVLLDSQAVLQSKANIPGRPCKTRVGFTTRSKKTLHAHA